MLAELEERETAFTARKEIYTGGDDNDAIYVVKEGWLHSSTVLIDGRRQIVKIHHPGDIIGFPDIAYEHVTTNLVAAEDCVLCPFQKSALVEIFRNSTKITSLFFALALRDQCVLIDNIRVFSRMSSRERLSWFLLDLISRLRVTNPDLGDMMRLPLTQAEIGDAISLSNVYVSRAFTALTRYGFLERVDGKVRLTNERKMRELVDFVDRYREMDTSWFDASASKVKRA
ncbi:Crp/Fnr family transcriptional regulator [Notoacmeibacter sp. MSK16QG-6]|uniref:Crp/Fnr family transcriptional regulator n=1 Tax=Notoacmeibacter sp. MSK16QG-6 TaxID=2957982 RepID=UPI00209EEB1F|nr:Crp/Fnr family transcriptional regulator [Notoacmeibacter sp. MSK16QG-6]